MTRSLHNYLLTHRKRNNLTQDHVAFLLGCQCGTKVSRYERFAREPSLRCAMAFEVIYHTSIRELFAGLYEEVEETVSERARELEIHLDEPPGSRGRRNSRKAVAPASPSRRDDGKQS